MSKGNVSMDAAIVAVMATKLGVDPEVLTSTSSDKATRIAKILFPSNRQRIYDAALLMRTCPKMPYEEALDRCGLGKGSVTPDSI